MTSGETTQANVASAEALRAPARSAVRDGYVDGQRTLNSVGRLQTDTVLHSMVACHECDLLHQKHHLELGQIARCIRCNAFLYANKPNSIDRALAVSLAALIMFVVANAFPFLAISVSGNTQSISIISAVFALSDEGMWLLGLLSFGFILLIPLLRVVGLLYILLPLRFERRLPGIEIVFRGIVALSPWSMMEIYMFGAIVALVKLASMANIELGLSFWAFALLNLLSVLAAQMVDNHSLWDFISHSRGGRHLFVGEHIVDEHVVDEHGSDDHERLL